ncbi:hypothetical protein NQ315_007827 [Exocentrus adspersus]|uniref:Uncharacterized protein n=1 Tax=Exocentrus adspersus TaxID=1586481 RepID=A0AAV8W9E2_9CUCU|nr:hypothetical protein NQ315_007827 [Exocentrus adspersus]
MRSSPIKTPKKTLKSSTKKPLPAKKRNMADLKSPIRDTISETISFVIKGKLTPIKPIMIDNKLDLISKTNKKPQKSGKVVKLRTNKKPGAKLPKKQKENSKTKPKVQIKAAKKPSAQLMKKSAERTLTTDVIPPTPKEKVKKNTKTEKKKLVTVKAQSKTNTVKKPVGKKNPGKKAKLKEQTTADTPTPSAEDNKRADEIEKQRTIEKLLKQANEEISKGTTKRVTSKERKNKKTSSRDKLEPSRKSKKKPEEEKNKQVPEPAKPLDYTSDEMPLKHLSERSTDDVEALSAKKPEPKTPAVKKKIKTKPKMTLLKKRVTSKNKSKEETRKTKLFGFWNGPKRHRVASLNALAKVHCLYENETRGNILDIIDEADIKKEYIPKKDSSRRIAVKKEPVVKEEADSDYEVGGTQSVVPTRTLRTLPGLRAIGKHWDMHETSSSSDENSDEDDSSGEDRTVKIKKEKTSKATDKNSDNDKKRRRNRNEILMDFKDMVVRKRMASLNASAILAASYSAEKRPSKTQKGTDDDSSSCGSGSSEEYFAASDDDTKEGDDIKKEEDRKLIEVHTTPNKKVAVILNQDTDVTITGVYVNSTTRSTHHEGYCSIAGMQYRISATSHTQTAATAVATETLLQSSSSSVPDNSNSDSMPSSKSYTPLDALSNMQPPPGPGIQHNHTVVHNQQHNMGPPQHVLPIPPHQISPGRRHGCSSAFSSPHSTTNYSLPPGHPPMQGEPGYVHGLLSKDISDPFHVVVYYQ